MHDVVLFVEDAAHEHIVGSLVRRLAREADIEVRLTWRSARHGYGKVANELKQFLGDLRRQRGMVPDIIIVATDANCKGFNERLLELAEPNSPVPMIFAVPDPHIERWLLLDGAAFRLFLGRDAMHRI